MGDTISHYAGYLEVDHEVTWDPPVYQGPQTYIEHLISLPTEWGKSFSLKEVWRSGKGLVSPISVTFFSGKPNIVLFASL